MSARVGSAITAKVIERITGTSGVNANLAALSASDATATIAAAQVRAQNVAAEIAERSTTTQYPAMNVYCEKISNKLTEKFRRFSGTAQMAMELRHSQDRLEGLEDTLEEYVDAAMEVLYASRGDWGNGMFYDGAYQATFSAVKHGGRNFLQTAKITFEIGVSKN
jgi:phosphate-selective porin